MVPPDSDRISLVPPYSGFPPPTSSFAYGALTLYGRPSQTFLLAFSLDYAGPTTPHALPHPVWAVPRSLATTQGITRLFSLPAATKMFQFTAFASLAGYPDASGWVAPFGHPRIDAPQQLPVAFRSLARPSSPLNAQASSVCPFLLASPSPSDKLQRLNHLSRDLHITFFASKSGKTSLLFFFPTQNPLNLPVSSQIQ